MEPSVEVLTTAQETVRLCTFDLGNGAICQSAHYARGFCEPHYRALKRSGAFANDPTPPIKRTPHDLVLHNSKHLRKAHRKLARLAPTFVDHLLRASEIAKEKGDHEPAVWAILHSRAIDPVATKSNTDSDSRTTINIGVKVSGGKDE